MGFSRKRHKIQTTIADALKKGLPLAGLLSSLMVMTSCDLFKKSSDDGPAAGYIPEPKSAQVTTQEQSEKPTIQPPADKQPDSPIGQGNNVSEAKSNETPWITTGTPQLPIITLSDELKIKILEPISPDSTIDSKVDPSKLKPVVGDPMIQKHE